MINFVAAATVAAVTIKQLVQARDGNTDQRLTDAFDPDDQPILEAVSAKLAGQDRAAAQSSPQGLSRPLPPGSSPAWAAGPATTASPAPRSCDEGSKTSKPSNTDG